MPDSHCNFVLVRFARTAERDAVAADAYLKSRGIIARRVASYGLPDCLRITIGLESEMRACVAALADFMGATPVSAEARRAVHFERIALIGIGLIGSSLARVVRRDGLADHIAVCARTHATLDKARALGIADSTTIDPRAAVEGADLVVLCTPLGAYADLAAAIAPACGRAPSSPTSARPRSA